MAGASHGAFSHEGFLCSALLASLFKASAEGIGLAEGAGALVDCGEAGGAEVLADGVAGWAPIVAFCALACGCGMPTAAEPWRSLGGSATGRPPMPWRAEGRLGRAGGWLVEGAAAEAGARGAWAALASAGGLEALAESSGAAAKGAGLAGRRSSRVVVVGFGAGIARDSDGAGGVEALFGAGIEALDGEVDGAGRACFEFASGLGMEGMEGSASDRAAGAKTPGLAGERSGA